VKLVVLRHFGEDFLLNRGGAKLLCGE
jgi:hypothetical protein